MVLSGIAFLWNIESSMRITCCSGFQQVKNDLSLKPCGRKNAAKTSEVSARIALRSESISFKWLTWRGAIHGQRRLASPYLSTPRFFDSPNGFCYFFDLRYELVHVKTSDECEREEAYLTGTGI